VITRAVGSREYVEVDTFVCSTTPGDAFLLCSDGLHGYLKPDEIPEVLALGPEPAVKHFITLANQRGGKDNITAVVVELA
jgi:protein phosphatase